MGIAGEYDGTDVLHREQRHKGIDGVGPLLRGKSYGT
jgi:hypothetical protein